MNSIIVSAETPVTVQYAGAVSTKSINTETQMSLIDSHDQIREELSRRSQAKTLFMEEALQRCEWAQRRFWGINE
jgi:hypothetical protein